MASIMKVTDANVRLARKAGFKRKKPSKPKRVTESSFESYVSRYNAWAKDLKAAAVKGKKLEDAQKKLDKMRQDLRGL